MECNADLQLGCGSWRHVSALRPISTVFGSSERQIAMTRVSRCRWLSLTAMSWLVLLAMTAFFPTQAVAGCNSPWVPRPGVDPPQNELRLFDPAFESLLAEPWSRQPSDRRAPCAGGSCTRSPKLPAGSTILISSYGERWCDLPAESTRMLPQSRGFSTEEDQRRSSPLSTFIERPPRTDSER
jgi:hypothetical protein